MTLQELSEQIGTMQLAKSKVEEFIGKNCRCPSLVPGTLYILKQWTIKHQVNSDNPFFVAEFIGSGHEDENGVRTMFEENPQIKLMGDGDHYYFKAWENHRGEEYEFGAYMHENCVCIASGAIRITAFSIKGHESEGFDTTPREAKPAKSPATSRAQGAVRKVRESNVVAIDREDIVIEDEDDGRGCEGAVQVHPISLRPIKPLYGRA